MERATTLMFIFFLLHKTYTAELNAITSTRVLTDEDTLVSATGAFELGFFHPGSSENKYLGIWYKKIPVRTVVWVANRDHPVPATSQPSVLKIVNPQTLGLFTNTTMIWSSNTTTTTSGITNATATNTTAKLHDNGNLVVIDERENVLWQSFDYPTDTLLPGMKLGRDYITNKEWHLTSWKSDQDPALGVLTWGADGVGYPESKLKQSGNSILFRGGPWRNQKFSGVSVYNKNLTFTYDVIVNASEVSFGYNLDNTSFISRVSLNSSGHLESRNWLDDDRGWVLSVSFPRDTCDTYNTCNANAICNVNAYCTCLDEKKFVPKNLKGWETNDWSGGCVRRTPLACENGSDGFVNYTYVKLPDVENTGFNMSMSLEECRVSCLKNCSCMAYASPDPSLERGCLLWFDDLLDLRLLPEGSGAGGDIFVRMAASEIDSQSISRKKSKGARTKIILLVIIPLLFVIGFISILFCYLQRKRNQAKPTWKGEILNASKSQNESMDHVSFSFSTIANATSNFSSNNKLGEGGFGPVYKGMLEGKEIAVKRLSKNSSQGLDEFKNEVICISKLQHRNLVKLIGYCIHGDEKLLIYEYMPNKSLDSLIFDETQSVLLDWAKRFNIIKGVASGLVYLHQDSRLRIIHRDLKASNILLDKDMNPKISDFGLARSFGGNETQANTERVVGTYGYMSPEYALDGIFSIKSDVYSFGVLVLEIVSGKRNRGYIHPENENNLFEQVWSLYNEGRSMELIDSNCVESCNPLDVMRSIHVGLLCVQENAGDRPNMSSVVMMLGKEGELPQPKKPSFFTKTTLREANGTSSTGGSINDVTLTEINPR